jgi:hypothetical protein
MKPAGYDVPQAEQIRPNQKAVQLKILRLAPLPKSLNGPICFNHSAYNAAHGKRNTGVCLHAAQLRLETNNLEPTMAPTQPCAIQRAASMNIRQMIMQYTFWDID